MIPKVIHYCWFGHSPLPPKAKKCIKSWKKHLPDYEIKEWNEDNFNVNIIPYTTEAYKAKKYAFVSDYARFWILYSHGGIYFDTDVEIIKSIDDIIATGPFMGCENEYKKGATNLGVNPGLGIGVPPGFALYKQLLELYSTLTFVYTIKESISIKTIVDYTTELLVANGLENKPGIQFVNGIYIYPAEYFCPINVITKRLHITPNTRTIHHYAATWMDKSWKNQLKQRVRRYLPESWLLQINRLKHK